MVILLNFLIGLAIGGAFTILAAFAHNEGLKSYYKEAGKQDIYYHNLEQYIEFHASIFDRVHTKTSAEDSSIL